MLLIKCFFFFLDIFVFFDKVNKYTKVEIIVFLQTLLRVTNTTNIRLAAAILNKICDMDGKIL